MQRWTHFVLNMVLCPKIIFIVVVSFSHFKSLYVVCAIQEISTKRTIFFFGLNSIRTYEFHMVPIILFVSFDEAWVRVIAVSFWCHAFHTQKFCVYYYWWSEVNKRKRQKHTRTAHNGTKWKKNRQNQQYTTRKGNEMRKTLALIYRRMFA